MRPLGWVSKMGAPVLLAAIAAAGSVLFPVLPAGIAAVTRACPSPTAFAQAVGSSARGPAIDAQLRLAPQLSSRGELIGRTLTLATAAGARTRSLAAEAFAAPAQANVVIFGQHVPATGSSVGAIDLQTGCEFVLWSSTSVVRSAVIDAGLDALYVHSVGASDRADQGVWRVDLTSGSSAIVLAPLAETTFGPTFATLLRWSLDGDALGVQSCGLAACRTRVLALADGSVETYGAADQGQIVGLTAGKLVWFDACPDLPCGLGATDRPAGRQAHFDIDAYGATLGEDGQGPIITVVTAAGTKEIRP